VTVSVSISPVKDATGQISAASTIVRDITERKLLEQRKDDFLSMASHELKTPLTSLLIYQNLLQRLMERNHNSDFASRS
jgi:two-component system sensor histidine kinase VicK